MTSIRQVLYISRAVAALGERDVQQILTTSQRNNWRQDITGCLLYSGRHFAQTLEGRSEALDPLLRRLNADLRHTDVMVLLDHEVQRRLYGNWSMALLYRMELVDEIEALLVGKPFTAADAALLMQSAGPDSLIGAL